MAKEIKVETKTAKEEEKKYNPHSIIVPENRRKEICPVCKEDFTDPKSQRAIACPGSGCTLLYHDRGGNDNCWETIQRCARPGCTGKQIWKKMIRREQERSVIKGILNKLNASEKVSRNELLQLSKILKENRGLELSPSVLKKILSLLENLKDLKK